MYDIAPVCMMHTPMSPIAHLMCFIQNFFLCSTRSQLEFKRLGVWFYITSDVQRETRVFHEIEFERLRLIFKVVDTHIYTRVFVVTPFWGCVRVRSTQSCKLKTEIVPFSPPSATKASLPLTHTARTYSLKRTHTHTHTHTRTHTHAHTHAHNHMHSCTNVNAHTC